MQYEIGKVIQYDQHIGIIKTINKKYIFMKQNAEDNIKENDLVKFRPEYNSKENIAHHVKKLSKNIKR